MRASGSVFSESLRFVQFAAVVGALELGALQARAAEAASDAAPAPSEAASSSAAAATPPAVPKSLAGMSVLAMGGFGTSTTNVRELNLAPYGGTFGLDVGYTFRVGLRVSAYFDYSVGRSEHQSVDPILGHHYEFDAATSSLSGGIALGWDVPVYALVLRYGLGFGITSMKWDFGDTRPVDVRFGGYKSPTVGFHFAPGMAVMYERGLFEAGVGFDYFAQANGVIPSGFLGKLLCGVRL